MNTQEVPAHPQKILVVDDDRIILKTLSFKLKSAGYEVIVALDGAQAVGTARKEKPDLILLDITFPPDVAHGGGVPWDGFLIMEWLRRMDAAKNMPMIVISGADPAKFKDRALAAGAIAYFQKPIDHDALLAAIRKALTVDAGGAPPKAPGDFKG